MDFNFDEIMNKVSETAKNVGDKASEIAKRAKLSTDLGGERAALKDAYAELGKALYDSLGEELEPEIAEKAAKVKLSLEVIAQKEKELEELRAKSGDNIRININGENPEIDAKIDEVKDKVAAGYEAVKEKAGEFSDKAGETINDIIEKGAQKVDEFTKMASDKAEDVADEVVEVVEEVKDTAEDKAEDVKEKVEETVEDVTNADEEDKTEEKPEE